MTQKINDSKNKNEISRNILSQAYIRLTTIFAGLLAICGISKCSDNHNKQADESLKNPGNTITVVNTGETPVIMRDANKVGRTIEVGDTIKVPLDSATVKWQAEIDKERSLEAQSLTDSSGVATR